MNKKQERELRKCLREMTDLLDKNAPPNKLISKLANTAKVFFSEEFKSRKHEFIDEFKSRKREVIKYFKKKMITKGKLKQFKKLSNLMVLRYMVQDMMARTDPDKIHPKKS
jgi:hypothetical protein